ncbi:hypothetical protein C8A00DRAFT_31469 [Chaetomidium leptoderma]|uniref:FAD-binding FR-type domain-containing protein n=1 Tax=Chaetomidium leptoderma TaxID=669021 RepID=A0AAN6VSY1_9PEZI|nr:hypothetical protein C8A00DRAFT_31469 [Chaetomidium leptoderma]
MATLLEHNGWHSGERAIHSLLKVPTSGRQNPTAPGLPPSYAHRVTVSHLLAVGTVDDQGRPWTSIWGGERGFAQPVAQNILGIQSLVDKTHDPVVQALLGKATKGEVLRPENGRTMSALSIDLDSRDRVKVAGKMAVGTVAGRPDNDTIGEVQIAMAIQESLGNCPKYLNKKAIRAHIPSPELVSSSLPLPPDALALIEKADMFFLSSTNGQTMDTNHRGGPAGFVRVVSNSPTDVVLAYPEFSGNRLYQTLGNLHTNPLIGIAIPDYSTSDVLYLTGSTQLLVGAAAASLMPHTNLAVKITVDSARFIKDGLPVRGTPLEPSPYNPPVRRLASQSPLSLSSSLQTSSQQQSPLATATLLRRDLLTPTIARFTFLLRPPSSSSNNQPLKTWQPGQHITLSFASELDMGYSHMREADPQSLNDDFVRTFTISSPPPPPPPPPPVSSSSGSVSGSGSGSGDGVEIQLTLRKHGPVTGLLFSQPIGAAAGVLEVPVLGVGGEEGFRIVAASAGSKKKKKAVFVAGGIGITPLLAQAPGVLLAAAAQAAAAAQSGKDVKEGGVEVLWSLRAEDLPLAVDAFERVEGLGSATRIFVTRGSGDGHEDGDVVAVIERVRALGAKVEVRRMGKEDLLGVRDAVRGTKYFACASPGMIRSVQDWFGEEEVVFESFEY